jgi:hypothetical protein
MALTCEKCVALGCFVDFENSQLLRQGHVFAGTFPENARMEFDHEHQPRGTVLTDNLINPNRILVVSELLCKFLVNRDLKAMEYLPIPILDHARNLIAENYFIAHTVDNIDCLDIEASKPKFGPLLKARITGVERLVLDPDRMDPERQIFRIKNFADEVIVRQDLADAVTAAGFTAVGFRELAQYNQ